MPLFTDIVKCPLPGPALRIVSLVPSITATLHALGLDAQVVGITKFCVHPAGWLSQKQVVGGTKNLHLDRIARLKPDLIIANREENVAEKVLALAESWPVWLTNVATLEQSNQMIRQLGQLTGTTSQADLLAGQIEAGFASLEAMAASLHQSSYKPAVLYFIWRKPWMVAGGDTFIHDIITRIGFANMMGHLNRYPQLTAEELTGLKPSQVWLSSEPYPFGQQHIAELRELLPLAQFRLVNGEYFSWYGSRMLSAVPYLASLLTHTPDRTG
jgi:ABC-type Fe3+-hydroxamate transport system substrate-binding protein